VQYLVDQSHPHIGRWTADIHTYMDLWAAWPVLLPSTVSTQLMIRPHRTLGPIRPYFPFPPGGPQGGPLTASDKACYDSLDLETTWIRWNTEHTLDRQMYRPDYCIYKKKDNMSWRGCGSAALIKLRPSRQGATITGTLTLLAPASSAGFRASARLRVESLWVGQPDSLEPLAIYSQIESWIYVSHVLAFI